MKHFIKLISPLGVTLLFVIAANGQANLSAQKSESSAAGSIARGTGKAAVIVVGSAAEAGWVVTKFTVKQVAKPVAKTIFLKAVPKLAVFALRNASVTAKKLSPTILKLALL